ncbi:translation elongation factor Ts [Patescibacteria group bacterium]|nr:translation elongation factor Ts [Patescibacteria group bacterium]MBU4600926.1 translation elongation factor Ts [Patescibacteria group bacterium]MCG2698652.1 translation elongation factor Ts [Candidatus Parcubacteria bacterium]
MRKRVSSIINKTYMEITMETIKILREKCGAGIVDCKKALEESGGNIEKAVEILRKKGIAKAAKRGDRAACEGIIKIAANEAGNEGCIVQISAETDFVVRNEKFQQFAEQVLELAKNKKPKNREELLALEMENGTALENLHSLSGVIGEKLDIKNCDFVSAKTVAAYSHSGGKIGVLVALDKEGESELAREIAMQIAASDPAYIYPEDVPEEEIEKEKEIYRAQLLREGKPEQIIGKILPGKLDKYFEKTCLVKQEYIKDDKKRVQDILGGVKVEKFIRYSL